MQHWLSTCKHIPCFILCLYNNLYSPAEVMSCEYSRYPSVPHLFLKHTSQRLSAPTSVDAQGRGQDVLLLLLSKHIETWTWITRRLCKSGWFKSGCFANIRFLQCRCNSVPKADGSFTKDFSNNQNSDKHDPWESTERTRFV